MRCGRLNRVRPKPQSSQITYIPIHPSMAFRKKKEDTLYQILGVEKDATADQIKSAYRKLSLRFHPDKNPAGAERFKEINRANEVLSDEEKRRIYDKFGIDGLHASESVNMRDQLVRTDETIQQRAGKLAALWVIFIILDWLFGVHLEWLAVTAMTSFFIYRLESMKMSLSVAVVVLDIVLCWLIPTEYIPYIASPMLYAAGIIWANIPAKAWDPSIGVWVLWMIVDYWYGRFYTNLSFFGAHTIVFSFVFLLLMVFLFQIQLIPEFMPSKLSPFFDKAINAFYETFREGSLFFFLSLLAWIAVWFLDSIFGVSFEWMVLAVFSVINIVTTWPLMVSSAFVTFVVILYYLFPIALVKFSANFFLYLFTVLLIGAASYDEEELKTMRASTLFSNLPKSFYLLFVVLECVDWFYRAQPERWILLACFSVVWSCFICAGLLLTEFSKSESSTDNDDNSDEDT